MPGGRLRALDRLAAGTFAMSYDRQFGRPGNGTYFTDFRVYQDLRFSFRLGVVIGIWLMPTPMPPRTFGGCFSRAFSAAAFVLNGFEILSG